MTEAGPKNSGYARSNRFQLRLVDGAGSHGGQGGSPLTGTAPSQTARLQPQYTASKFKLVRSGAAGAPAGQTRLAASAGTRPGAQHGRQLPQAQRPIAQQQHAVVRPKQQQQQQHVAFLQPRPPPPQEQPVACPQPRPPPPQEQPVACPQPRLLPQKQLPSQLPSQQQPAVHKALDRAGGQQRRILVYSKSGSGKGLQRTGVRGVAAKHAMTWRNPTATGASSASPAAAPGAGARQVALGPKPGQMLLARVAPAAPARPLTGGSAALQAAVRQPLVLPGRPAAAARKRGGGKWNKYVRLAAAPLVRKAAVAQQQQQRQPPVAKRAGKWNKFVRVGARSSGAAKPAAPSLPSVRTAMATVQPRKPASSSSSSSRSASVSKAQRLLRLGSSMYKVLSKGRSRSLHRQRSSPLPPQQQEQQRQQEQQLGAGSALAQRAAPKQGRRAPAPLMAAGGVKKASAKLPRSPADRRPSSGGRIVFCPVYCRTGKCARRGKGCPYKHDPTKRTVCPRWLHGACADAQCPLQHQRKKELMPVCMHFLKGLCTAADCPYLHVNLSAEAPVCKAFLRGYCPAGADCAHKHYTLKMVKEERQLERRGGAAEARGGRKRGGRYFAASQQPGSKMARSCSDPAPAAAAAAAAAVATVCTDVAAGEAGGDGRQEGSPDYLFEDIIPL